MERFKHVFSVSIISAQPRAYISKRDGNEDEYHITISIQYSSSKFKMFIPMGDGNGMKNTYSWFGLAFL